MIGRFAPLRAFRRLRASRSGAAAVEFALILPIMLFLYVGTIEASALISMDRKVQSVSGALGDLVARVETRVTSTQLRDYFRAASGIMTPFPATQVRQEVTVVSVADDGQTSVVWSREFFGGTYENGVLVGSTFQVNADHPPGSAFPLPEATVNIARGGTIIVADATYSYLPLYGIVFNQAVNLHRASYFAPRFGGSIGIN